MGLLDEAYAKFAAYKQANTPRNTRPAVNPAQVMDQGLLGGAVSRIPANAQSMYQGLLAAPDELSALASPNMNQQVNQAMSRNVAPDRQQWMDAGLELSGMAPVTAPLGMFIGKGAKVWDAIKAQQAEGLLAKGVDPKQVWQQTGTMRGVDGALRQEIPDNEAAWLRNFPFERRMEPMNNVISHDGLYQAYPETENITALFGQNVNAQGGTGSYHFDPALGRGIINIESGGSDAIQKAKSIGLHELQHAIQQREGWAMGGSPEGMAVEWSKAKQNQDFYSTIDALARTAEQDFGGNVDDAVKNLNEFGFEITPEHVQELMRIGTGKAAKLSAEAQNTLKQYGGGGQYGDAGHNLYKRLAGEAEARLTQSRIGLDSAQRLEHYPMDAGPYGFDVPPEQQIVRGLLDGPAKQVKKK